MAVQFSERNLIFQKPRGAGGERPHLADGDGVELGEAFAGGEGHVDEFGVEAFEVGEDEELLDGGVVAHVAVELGVCVAPLAGGVAEEGDIQQIGLAGVGGGGLRGGDFGRDEVRPHCVGVDAVVELREGAVEVPREGEAAAFVLLEALEFLDEVDFEFGADPHAELERNVAMGECAAVASGARAEADGRGFFDPILHAELVAVQAGLAFNCGEFAGIKTRVVDSLPDAEELDGVPVAQPVGDEKVAVLGLEHVGERNVVTVRGAEDGDFDSLDFDGGFGGLFHVGKCSAHCGSGGRGGKVGRIRLRGTHRAKFPATGIFIGTP